MALGLFVWLPTWKIFRARLHSFSREHRCAFKLAQILWDAIVAPSDSTFQQSRVIYGNMETPLYREIMWQLDKLSVPLTSCGGFRHSHPTPTRPRCPVPHDIQGCIEAMREGLETELNDAIDGFVFLGDVTELSLQAQGFTELVRNPPATI